MLNEQELAQFHDQLIDVTVCLCICDRSGYSLVNSFDYATSYLEEPRAAIWRELVQGLFDTHPVYWEEHLDTYMVALQSDGLRMFNDAMRTYRNPSSNTYIPLTTLTESALDALWTRYSSHTKPDSVKFDDVFRWMRELGHEDAAIRQAAKTQFDRMQHHAVSYLSAVAFGVAHDRKVSLEILQRYDTPLAKHTLDMMHKS